MQEFGCEAVLFDLDGVLVDSNVVVERIWREWAGKFGIDAERLIEVSHGRRSAEIIRLFAPDLDADSEARKLDKAEVEDLDGVLEIKGAGELLSSLPKDGWKVATSGTRSLATKRMEHVGLPVPERFVSADDVANGKPHPEPYLKGAELLGVRPEACVVVEDALNGVRAAKSAGMLAVAVATTYRREDLSEADAVANSLEEIVVTARTRSRGDDGLRFELRIAE